jgi:predicted outer membrane repeat protein
VGGAASIFGSIFGNNSAQQGGALFVQNLNISLSNCSFLKNGAIHEGGAAYLTHASATIPATVDFHGCDISENSARTGIKQ